MKKIFVLATIMVALLVQLPVQAQEIIPLVARCPESIYLETGTNVYTEPELLNLVARVGEPGSFPVLDCTDTAIRIDNASGNIYWVGVPVNVEPATPISPTAHPDRAIALTALGADLTRAGYELAEAQLAFDSVVASQADPTTLSLITFASEGQDGVAAVFATKEVAFSDPAGMGEFHGPAGVSSVIYTPTPSTIAGREALAFAQNATGRYIMTLTAAMATPDIRVTVGAVVEGRVIPVMVSAPVVVTNGIGRFNDEYIHLPIFEMQINKDNRISAFVITVEATTPWRLAIDQNAERSAIGFNVADFIPSLDYVQAVLVPQMAAQSTMLPPSTTPAPSATPVPTQPTPSATPAPLRPLPTSAPEGAADTACVIGGTVLVPSGTRIFDDGKLKIELGLAESAFLAPIIYCGDLSVGYAADGMFYVAIADAQFGTGG